MRFRHAASIVLILSVSIAAPVLAKGPNDPKVSASTSPKEGFRANSSTTIRTDRTKKLYFRVFSPVEQDVNFFSITGGASSKYEIRWYKGSNTKGADITQEVTSDGFEYAAEKRERTLFTAKVKHTGSGQPLCMEARVQKRPITSSSFDRAFFALNDKDACNFGG